LLFVRNPSHMKKALLAGTLAVILSGCITSYREYVGGSVMQGNGGTREIIKGIEYWEDGAPSRPFRVIGIINDRRPGGPIPMALRKIEVVTKAKKYGGDAVVMLDDNGQIVGGVNTFNATANTYGSTTYVSGSGVSVPVIRREGKYEVIKYVSISRK